LLSLENILLLFRALMIESQIVVISKNLGLLSAVTLSFIPLLRPYVFQGPFIPILPDDFIDYLDAPVPYVIGAFSFPASKDYLRPEKFIINIDTNEVWLPDGGVPELPEPQKLKEPLTLIHKELNKANKKPNPYQDMSKDTKNLAGIVGAFKNYQCWLMDDVIIKHVDIASQGQTQRLTEFDFGSEKMKELVETMPTGYRPFMTTFLSSQQFSSYSDKLLEIIHKKDINNLPKGSRSHSSDAINTSRKNSIPSSSGHNRSISASQTIKASISPPKGSDLPPLPPKDANPPPLPPKGTNLPSLQQKTSNPPSLPPKGSNPPPLPSKALNSTRGAVSFTTKSSLSNSKG